MAAPLDKPVKSHRKEEAVNLVLTSFILFIKH